MKGFSILRDWRKWLRVHHGHANITGLFGSHYHTDECKWGWLLRLNHLTHAHQTVAGADVSHLGWFVPLVF